MLIFSFVPTATALTEVETENQYFEDGSYITVGFEDAEHESTNNNFSFITQLINLLKKIIAYLTGKEVQSQTKTVSKTKYAGYYDAKGNLLWSVYLTAEFSYNVEKAECTEASVSYNIIDSDRKLISSDCSKNNATATGTFLIRQYKLGVPLKSIEKILTLTCDTSGNVK